MKHYVGGNARHHGSGKIQTKHLKAKTKVSDLIDTHFNAYNGARLRETCHLMAKKVERPGVYVGVSLSGALIPAGFASMLIPLMEKGFIDYIVSTGANLYHDSHFALGYDLYRSTPFVDDVELFRKRLIRIYDIIVDFDVLLKSDQFFYRLIDQPEFQKKMSSSELHYRFGRYIDSLEKQTNRRGATLLAAAYRCDVPIYTSSPGDSTIGMNVAARAMVGGRMEFDVSLDVNETTAIVYEAKKKGRSAVVILGGGSPKNFLLQTEPQLQEILGLQVSGHDYFIQITDARPDTGGLSGATPAEAVSWGKIRPEMLPNAVVCYSDTTLAFPLVAAYVLERCRPRPLKRLYSRREELVKSLQRIVEARRKKGRRSDRGTIGGIKGVLKATARPASSKKPRRGASRKPRAL
jgi:deoxyhypusine synthase